MKHPLHKRSIKVRVRQCLLALPNSPISNGFFEILERGEDEPLVVEVNALYLQPDVFPRVAFEAGEGLF